MSPARGNSAASAGVVASAVASAAFEHLGTGVPVAHHSWPTV